MKKLFLFFSVSVFVFFSCSDDDDATNITYTLDLPALDAETEFRGNEETFVKSWSMFEGTPYETTYYQYLLTDKSDIFAFDCISGQWGIADGFEFTNLTSGYFSAVPAKGVNGATYITSYYDSYNNNDIAIRFREENSRQYKEYTVKGLYITNNYGAYNAMLNGEGMASEFNADSWFKLTIYNLEKTKKAEVMLAEGTNIVTDWKWVDLSALGRTSGLRFELSSSDSDEELGMNTPAYFCLDGIKIEE